MDIAEAKSRIERYVVKDENGCWIWTRHRNAAGYGRLSINGKPQLAHRIAYQLYVGDIPPGLELDHLCRVRCCCNPAHLEPVTRKENARRGISGQKNGARQRSITHCPKGHAYNDENTMVSKSGSRECRECRRTRNRKWYAECKSRRNNA